MSTRANIVVHFGRTRIYLYRHHDGYPAETGADIVKALRQGKDADGFLHAILAQSDSAFEITNDIHGDVEWFYVLSFTDSKAPQVAFAHRGDLSESADATYARITAPLGTVEDLIARVNQDRREINTRLDVLQKQGRYTDTTRYTPITTESNHEPVP